jgi:hypothetical protein
MKCPCCGHEMKLDLSVEDLRYVEMSPSHKRVIDLLISSHPDGITNLRISRATGFKPGHISVLVFKIRKIIRPFGWRVSSRPGRGSEPYFLEKMHDLPKA